MHSLKQNCKLFLLLFVLLSACVSGQEGESKLTIVTTTGIIGDCISELVGDQAEVIAIMGPGVDPHLYKASQGDLVKLSKAHVIIYNGLHLEGKMAQVLKKSGRDKTILSMGEFAPDARLKHIDEESELRDPHIWFDPELWMQCLESIALELEKEEGLNGVYQNFLKYKAQVLAERDSLKVYIENSLSENQRILITSHDAFAYFGRAFGFEVRGLQGISTAAEFGIKDVTELIDYIIERKVRAVFIETSVSDKNLKSVVEGARARGYELKVGGTLFSDALGEKDGPAENYLGMLKENVHTIVNGLQ